MLMDLWDLTIFISMSTDIKILKDIKRMYCHNQSSIKIGKKYGKSGWWVIERLKEQNVPIRPPGGQNFVDLIGNRYGRYTVIGRAPMDKYKTTRWFVKCDCGNVRNVCKSTSTLGTAKSCGKCHNRKGWKGYGDIGGCYWTSIKRGALKRKLCFNLRMKDAWNIFLKQGGKCAISGMDIAFVKQDGKNKRGHSASLDRIDSSKGYTPDNVQWVHKTINIMKGDMPDKEFLKICGEIVEHNKKI